MIEVIGGGPAGLAAAITLARAERPVVLHEAGTFPRHRVCGEFLCAAAQPWLARLGLADLTTRLGAPVIDAVRLTSSWGGRRVAEAGFRLDAPGAGLARFDFDSALADVAREAGVEVRERSRVMELPAAEAVIVATGRIARAGDGARAADAGRWVGIKQHLRGEGVRGVTEIHAAPGAYVGINTVASRGERVVNVCGLLRADAWERSGCDVAGAWKYLADQSPPFAERWRRAEPVDGSGPTVAGFGFAPRLPRVVSGDRSALAVGDAVALTAPIAGAGQAAALAMGVSAAECVLEATDAAGAVGAWEHVFASRFRGRRRMGVALQRALLVPMAAAAAIQFARLLPPAAAWTFRATRA